MISVIGAGPIGSYTAYQLAKQGHTVNVYEDHAKIGLPVQCTGILTNSIREMMKIEDDFVVANMKWVRVIAPNGEELRARSKDIIVCRTKFDNHIAELAQSEGVKYQTSSRYTGITKKGMKINDKEVKTDTIVGADGPVSAVAKSAGIYGERKFCTGLQAKAPYESDADEFLVYLVDDICPGFFAWVVPESEKHARVGLGMRTNPREHFQRFMKRIGNPKILEQQGGLIPIYDRKLPIQTDNVFLVGDAATQVKPTTGGGIVPAMRAANQLVRTVNDGGNYFRRCAWHVGKDLYVDTMIRNAMDKMSDQDINKLVASMSKPGIQKVLAETDRDNQFKLAAQIMIRCPQLLMHGFKLF